MPKKRKPAPDLSTLAERAVDEILAGRALGLLEFGPIAGEEVELSSDGVPPACTRLRDAAGEDFDLCDLQEAFNKRFPNEDSKEALRVIYGSWWRFINARQEAAYVLGIAMGKRLAGGAR